MGGNDSKVEKPVEPVPVVEATPVKPKQSQSKPSRPAPKSLQKSTKEERSHSVSTTNLASTHKSVVRGEHADPNNAAQLINSVRKGTQSTIRIKEPRKPTEKTLANPERRPEPVKEQKSRQVSQVIDIDAAPAMKQSGVKKQIPANRSSFKGKKPFDPKLSELIKLYGFQ